MNIDKKKLRDSRGRPLTQGLFLEVGYNTEFAMYTQKDEDYEYKGVVYPSLKRLYLEHEDPVEYDFACTYLLGWSQWQRICKNKLFASQVAEWRLELELKLRSQAVRDIVLLSAGEKGFQSAKWLADRGWDKRAAGRPSAEDVERRQNMDKKIEDEYASEVSRLADYKIV